MPTSVRGRSQRTRLPSIVISPAVGATKPASAPSKVDFPQPEGPRTQASSPGSMAASRSRRATIGVGPSSVTVNPRTSMPAATRSPLTPLTLVLPEVAAGTRA